MKMLLDLDEVKSRIQSASHALQVNLTQTCQDLGNTPAKNSLPGSWQDLAGSCQDLGKFLQDLGKFLHDLDRILAGSCKILQDLGMILDKILARSC